MANYSTPFYMQLRKHICKNITFRDTTDLDPKAIKGIAMKMATDGAIPIQEATYEMVSQFFQFIQDKQSLLAYDPSSNLWRQHRDSALLENFLQDYFVVLLEEAKAHKDGIYKEYATHFFNGKAIHFLAERIKHSMMLNVNHGYEITEANENLRYFNLIEPAAEGGRIRGLLDMSAPSFNLEAVTWKDTFQRHLSYILPSPIATDDTDEPKLWLSLIETYMMNDPEKIEYFHKVLAYLMAPYNYNQCIIFFYGEGGKNGKSTILKVLMDILGPHAVRMNSDLLNAKPPVSFKKDDALAATEGKSLLIFNEVDERMQMSTQNVKDLTEGGRDEFGNKTRTVVRPAYSPNYEICISGTPLVALNSLLNMGEWASIDSIFRRLVIVPFEYRIDNEDPTILNRLAKEYPQIQLWLYRNYFKYKDINIKSVVRPADFEKVFQMYRNDSDLLRMFVDDCVTTTDMSGDHIKRSDLYRMYQKYCKVNGRMAIKAKGSNGFLNMMKSYIPDSRLKKTNGDFVYMGVKPSVYYEDEVNNAPTFA